MKPPRAVANDDGMIQFLVADIFGDIRAHFRQKRAADCGLAGEARESKHMAFIMIFEMGHGVIPHIAATALGRELKSWAGRRR